MYRRVQQRTGARANSERIWRSATCSARPVRLVARRVNSLSSEFVRVIASLMDTIIVYKWLLQSTSSQMSVSGHVGWDLESR
jgi:hypothetical protein